MQELNKISRKLICILILFSTFVTQGFCDSTTPEPYDMEEIPQSLQDLRRFEIISLGAMPFVMMDTTLVYSSYRYVKNDFSSEFKPTPFPTNKSFTSDEQVKLVLTSLGISAAVGLTDFIVRHIKRSSIRRNEDILRKRDIDISVSDSADETEQSSVPIEQDEDAVRIELPSSKVTESGE